MPATTPTYALPYQTLADTPDGPSLGEDLALAVEAQIVRLDAALAVLTAGVAAINTKFPVALGIPAAPITTASNGTATSGTTETPDSVLGIYTFTAVAGVRYRACISGRSLSMTVASDKFDLRMRYTTDGSTPTAASTLLDHNVSVVNGASGSAGANSKILLGTFVPGAATVKIISTWTRSSGTGAATPTGICSMWVESIGNV